MTDLTLKVTGIGEETPIIKSFTLSEASGNDLPGYSSGAHIRVSLPEGGDRAYSLIDFAGDGSTETGAREYRIAVRLEEESAGGSKFMHGLNTGDIISTSLPKNDFPLLADTRSVTLLAGGIGITPLIGMAARLQNDGRDFNLHYSGRSRGALAFDTRLKTMLGGNLVEHYDEEPETALDITALAGRLSPEGHIYVCGPKGMIEATKRAALARGFPSDHIHFELFTNQAEAAAGGAFEIELASTGEVLQVPEGKSIIDVLEDAGHDVLYDCQRGDCGICQTEVISGTPDHRDVVLSDDEKASGKVMQICVSRALSERLVLDL